MIRCFSLGPDHYDSAILPFYMALKVYPAPQELLMIYQKTLPEPVFTTITTILLTEVIYVCTFYN
jgi:import receptor subunit TOM20